MMNLKDLVILYVEDEEELGRMMRSFLEDDVKEFYWAKDGEEGLELFKQYSPDIVISDIYMPKMNGLKMSEEIKKVIPHQAIVLLTAFSDVKDMQKAIEIGINSYINKPVISMDQMQRPLKKIADEIHLKKENERLKQLVFMEKRTAAISEMLNNVAHQWRQPLASIGSICTSLSMQVQLGKPVENDFLLSKIESINQQVQYLSQTLENFKELNQDKAETSMQQMNLKDALEYALMIVSRSIEEHQISIVEDSQDIVFQGSINYYAEIFINLFNNSLDAMIQNNIENRYIFISLRQEDSNVVFHFKDNGGGIANEVFEKIFDPYLTTKHQARGTGLGLYIVNEFVRKVHGTIEVKNVEYSHNNIQMKGAEFIISIPIKND